MRQVQKMTHLCAPSAMAHELLARVTCAVAQAAYRAQDAKEPASTVTIAGSALEVGKLVLGKEDVLWLAGVVMALAVMNLESAKVAEVQHRAFVVVQRCAKHAMPQREKLKSSRNIRDRQPAHEESAFQDVVLVNFPLSRSYGWSAVVSIMTSLERGPSATPI